MKRYLRYSIDLGVAAKVYLLSRVLSPGSQVKPHRVDQERRARPPLWALLVAPHVDQRGYGDEQAKNDRNGPNRSCQPMYIFAREVAAQSTERGPYDTPSALKSRKEAQAMLLTPARKAAQACKTAIKRPLPSVLPWFITFVVALPQRIPAAVDSGCL